MLCSEGIISAFFLFHLADCDHPVYSETKHQNVNLTTWNKPWPPEIDWLDSYVNLSSYHPNILELLAVGYKTTENAKYFAFSEWGCIMMFQWDAELADSYYLEHYAGTNDTKYICTPYIPMRPDMRRKYAQTYPDRHSMVRCSIYQLGFIKRRHFPIESRIFVIAAPLVLIIGVVGEYRRSWK